MWQGLFALILLLSSGSWGRTLCGDCNADGIVSVIDALTAAQSDVGLLTLCAIAFNQCDVEAPAGDGAVTVLDALRIAQHVVGVLPSLSCGLGYREWSRMFSPPELIDHSMSFDSAREVTVLFGGRSNGLASNRLFEWDGSVWRSIPMLQRPPHTIGGQQAFDESRGRSLLFGGLVPNATESDYVRSNALWSWDGCTWSELQSPMQPPGRHHAAMSYDAFRDRLVLFGGDARDSQSFDPPLGDTWLHDGNSWMPWTPVASPSPRYGAMMTFDSQRIRTVLFGGWDGVQHLADTWEFTGTNWIERFPASSPPGRVYGGLAYDSARRVSVLFGGEESGGSTQSLWEWNGSNWIERTDVIAHAETWGNAMAYDSARQAVVQFGGRPIDSDTYEYDGVQWQLVSSINVPRMFGSFGKDSGAYEPDRQVVVGISRQSGFETWEWDGLAWIRHLPAVSPSRRSDCYMAFDHMTSATLLFGGSGFPTGGVFNDTWLWDGIDWIEQFPATQPPLLVGSAMASDPVRMKIVLFGGRDFGGGAPGPQLNDTWEWNGNDWRLATPSTSPAARSYASLAFDPVAGASLLTQGWSGSGVYHDDTWLYDGLTWTRLFPSSQPPVGYKSPLAYDVVSGRMLLYHAFDNETWQWDGQSWHFYQSVLRPLKDEAYPTAFYDEARGYFIMVTPWRGQTGMWVF